MTTVRSVVIPVVSVMTRAQVMARFKKQLLLYIPLRNLRHDQQIAEVKTAPDYPR